MSNRVRWIDTAKGFGALYVIFGHFILNDNISALIYAFHMPLFFFLAGLTLNIKDDESFSYFVKKKFTSIIVPYLIFSIPLFLFNCIMIIHNGKDTVMQLIKKIIGIILCWKTTDFYNGVWFLPCIFMVYVISYIVIKKIKSEIIIVFLSVASFILGLALDKFNITLPLCIDTALVAFGFMGIAYASKFLIGKIKWFSVFLYIPMCVIAYMNFNAYEKRIEMYSNDYGNYGFFLIASLCGIVATIGLANIGIFANNSFLNLLGKESMYLYGSQLIFLCLKRVILPKTGIYSFNSYIQTIIGFIMSCLLILFLVWIKPLYYIILNKIVKR